MRRPFLFLTLSALCFALVLLTQVASAHSNPCHQAHSCPSDHHSYLWQGLSCTSYANERLASDKKVVVYGGRSYYCHAASSTSTTSGGSSTSSGSSGPIPVFGAGSCHYQQGGTYADPRCTPGVTNPAVTQKTIHSTICVSGYTKTIRPPSSVTGPEKLASMRAYGVGKDSPSQFEYDHLISLELGGAPNDTRNLWPQPHYTASGHGSYAKDAVENLLHAKVCSGAMTLRAAQYAEVHNWIAYSH